MRRIILTAIALSASAWFGCRSSTYYSAMEKVGYQKREMLNNRLEEARDSQLKAKDVLESSLSTLRQVESAHPRDLPVLHESLKKKVHEVKKELTDLRSDIASVESVAQAMFNDWERDLVQFRDDELRARSRQALEQSRTKYSELIASLRTSERQLQSVVPPLEDQVLFLQHASKMSGTPPDPAQVETVREQISTLIRQLDHSIGRTQHFITEGVEAAA